MNYWPGDYPFLHNPSRYRKRCHSVTSPSMFKQEVHRKLKLSNNKNVASPSLKNCFALNSLLLEMIMDGFTATEETRKIDKQVPIVVQTAFALKTVKEKTFKVGCNDFITKPLNQANLVSKVEECIH